MENEDDNYTVAQEEKVEKEYEKRRERQLISRRAVNCLVKNINTISMTKSNFSLECYLLYFLYDCMDNKRSTVKIDVLLISLASILYVPKMTQN